MSATQPIRPFAQSLCHQCKGVRYTQSKAGSLFLMCQLMERRYPPQPVHHCSIAQPRPLLKVILHFDDQSQQELSFCLPPRLEALVSHTVLNEMVSLTWQKHNLDDLQELKFSPIFTEHKFLETIEDATETQLCPPGYLSLSPQGELSWSSSANRAPLFAWLNTRPQEGVISSVNELMTRASKLTLMLRIPQGR